MAPPNRDVQSSNDWSLAAVGLIVVLIVLAIFFRETVVEYTSLFLYFLWSLADIPQTHHLAAWRINLLVNTHNHAQNVSWSEFFSVMDLTAGILLLFLVPAVVFGVLAVRGHQASRTRRDISIRTLPRIMSVFSPAIIPALNYGDKKTQLLNVDPEEHRSAASPEEFAKENRLVVNRQLRHDLAEACFFAQLGKAFTSGSTPAQRFEQFSDHERAMFAIFGLQHFLDKRKEAEALVDTLNRSTLKSDRKYRNKTGYPNLSLADADFRRVTSSPDAIEWIRRYRYARTAIQALHDNDLHLPIRRYRWLKGLDRTLWYALASTGRPWPFIEGTAVVSQAHWETVSAQYGIHLDRPIMRLAIEGLEADLRNLGAVAEEMNVSPATPQDDGEEDEDDDEDDTSAAAEQEPHVHRHVHTFKPKMR
jgi:intracellular multiplication protein IcmP